MLSVSSLPDRRLQLCSNLFRHITAMTLHRYLQRSVSKPWQFVQNQVFEYETENLGFRLRYIVTALPYISVSNIRYDISK